MRSSKRILGTVLCLPFLAAIDLPDNVPVPQANPRPVGKLPKPETKPQDPASNLQEKARATANQASDDDTAEDAATTTLEPTVFPPVDEAALAACEQELRALGVAFRRLDRIAGLSGCGVSVPYDVSQIAPGVSVKPSTQLACETVLATARWVKEVVRPAVRVFGEDASLSGLTHASTYVCRRRNNKPDGKLSEHALGLAIDIASFQLVGAKDISVAPRAGEGTPAEAFQRAVRGGACLHFTTVLGPGSDGFHGDHIHLDVIQRRRTYRLCQ